MFLFSRHVAQLYYLVTKIKWEYDTQPNILKGGTPITTSITGIKMTINTRIYLKTYNSPIYVR